jgi:hypothetical protein
MLARHLGVSRTIVHRVWQRHEVQPRRVERFKLSEDPQFERTRARIAISRSMPIIRSPGGRSRPALSRGVRGRKLAYNGRSLVRSFLNAPGPGD